MHHRTQGFAIARPTGYLWIRRYHQHGLAGLQDLSRRPASSPKRTPARLEQRILALRQQRPDWGARKLQVLLAREGVSLPVITVHRILLRHGLVGEEGRVQRACQRFERDRPNELWRMDFKGPRGWDKPVGPAVGAA